jgi:hypothetical protein
VGPRYTTFSTAWLPPIRLSRVRHHLQTDETRSYLIAQGKFGQVPAQPAEVQPDWASLYEGLPNAEILDVSLTENTGAPTVTIRLSSGTTKTCKVGGLAYVVGRRGSLDFLSSDLCAELLGSSDETVTISASQTLISGRTLRPKSESSLEVAKNVFIIGSLAGDSLIRHAVGGCVFAAGRILKAIPSTYSPSPSSSPSPVPSTPRSVSPTPESNPSSQEPRLVQNKEGSSVVANGHEDLHLDRRKMTRVVEMSSAENLYWVNSGWWAGGPGPGRVDV